MIPKIIHYCWFGEHPLPKSALKCIASWKKFCPDYEIKEWNENNYDINSCDYVREAYQAGKWAFVSDFARFDILYQYGGIYFDTDVELIRPIDDIIEKGSFMGCEVPPENKNMRILRVAPGLGLAAVQGLSLYKEIIDDYRNSHFVSDGNTPIITVVHRVTNILMQHGFTPEGRIQLVADIYIYPCDYFCPMSYYTGKINITENTRSIHHYSASWVSSVEKIMLFIRFKTADRGRIIEIMGWLAGIPFRIVNKVNRWIRRV